MSTQPHEQHLAIYATKASLSRGRYFFEALSASRTEFQRDRDRIIHSNAFRKMRNKTQVFIESEGDYYRTRLTHSLEVAQIARSISRALGLDEDLTETIALAHDLGHTCFGHAGEESLDEAMRDYGGFDHNEQTFRILTKLEHRYARFDGLNLTWETLEGIVKHNGPVLPDTPLPYVRAFDREWSLEIESFAGPEAQVAALSDDIAYNTHDADDGHHAGFFTLEALHELPVFGPAFEKMQGLYPSAVPKRVMYEVVREAIGVMINDVIETSRQNIEALDPQSVEEVRSAPHPVITFSEGMSDSIGTIQRFLRENMYRQEDVNDVCRRARKVVRDLFDFYVRQPNCLPAVWNHAVRETSDRASQARTVADYIAGMTDRYALQAHRKLFASDIML